MASFNGIDTKLKATLSEFRQKYGDEFKILSDSHQNEYSNVPIDHSYNLDVSSFQSLYVSLKNFVKKLCTVDKEVFGNAYFEINETSSFYDEYINWDIVAKITMGIYDSMSSTFCNLPLCRHQMYRLVVILCKNYNNDMETGKGCNETNKLVWMQREELNDKIDNGNYDNEDDYIQCAKALMELHRTNDAQSMITIIQNIMHDSCTCYFSELAKNYCNTHKEEMETQKTEKDDNAVSKVQTSIQNMSLE